MLKLAAAVTLSVAGWLAPASAGEAPKVVVTIKPLHSLVAGVMAGIGQPSLLIGGGASPHAYALRPSEARALAEADLVFWVGEDLERFMTRPLAALRAGGRTVALSAAPGLTLLPVRSGGAWEADDDAHEAEEAEARNEADHTGLDMHFWLDPRNARAIVTAALSALVETDPARADLYRANGRSLLARLARLDGALGAELSTVRDVPYVTFHDAYQYFERRYGLNGVGSITVSAERSVGAKRLRAIREKIGASNATCVFVEPQFAPDLARAVIDGTRARMATLDPLGAAIAPGPEAYFQLLENLSRSFAGCLAPQS